MCLEARLEVYVYAYEGVVLLDWTQHRCDPHDGGDELGLKAVIWQFLLVSDCGDVCGSVRAWRFFGIHGHWDRPLLRSIRVHRHHDVFSPEHADLGLHDDEAAVLGDHQHVYALYRDDVLGAARCGTRDDDDHRGESAPSHGVRVVPGGFGDRGYDALHDVRVPRHVHNADSSCIDDRDGLPDEQVLCDDGLHACRREDGTNPCAGVQPHLDDHGMKNNARFARPFRHKSRHQQAMLDGSYS